MSGYAVCAPEPDGPEIEASEPDAPEQACTTVAARSEQRRQERGTGLLPTAFGLAILLGMLGMATNVALGLWSRSATESVAYRALRLVATAPPGADPDVVRALALERACDELGTRCTDVELRFLPGTPGDDMVALRVSAPGVGLLPRFISGGGPIVTGLDRTMRMNKETP